MTVSQHEKVKLFVHFLLIVSVSPPLRSMLGQAFCVFIPTESHLVFCIALKNATETKLPSLDFTKSNKKEKAYALHLISQFIFIIREWSDFTAEICCFHN